MLVMSLASFGHRCPSTPTPAYRKLTKCGATRLQRKSAKLTMGERPLVSLSTDDAAISRDVLPREPTALFADEESDHVSDIFRLPQAMQWRHLD